MKTFSDITNFCSGAPRTERNAQAWMAYSALILWFPTAFPTPVIPSTPLLAAPFHRLCSASATMPCYPFYRPLPTHPVLYKKQAVNAYSFFNWEVNYQTVLNTVNAFYGMVMKWTITDAGHGRCLLWSMVIWTPGKYVEFYRATFLKRE